MLNIDIVLDLANDYSVNAGVFRDSGNFVKEYANLCSATALYLLALQSEQLDRDQRQELITKCESYIKLQEEIEHTRFSVDELIATDSPSKKKRKKKTAETSLKVEEESTQGFQQQQLLQHASNVDDKDFILAAEETHEYYSESDDSVDFNPNKKKSPKKKTTPKKQVKIKSEPTIPAGTTSQVVEDVQLVQVQQDPVVVSAPDHFGYCTVTPDAEITEGFYNFSAAQLKAFSERFKGKTYPNVEMRSTTGRKLESEVVLGQCKNYLCAPDSKVREWFPTMLQGRLRAKALDPYGFVKPYVQKSFREKLVAITFNCKVETCHAKLVLRKVTPDPEGNEYGLYGCFQHQHEMITYDEDRKSEIVFKNRIEAETCFYENFKIMYASKGEKREEYEIFKCRRSALKEGLGFHPCKSTISIHQTFSKETLDPNISKDEKPFSLSGIFYHPHKNDERFHKNKHGGFRKNHDDPKLDKPRKKLEIRIKNGQIFPIYARKYVTIEEILAARVGKGGHKRKKKPKPPVNFKTGCSITTNMIDLEERIRNSTLPISHETKVSITKTEPQSEN